MKKLHLIFFFFLAMVFLLPGVSFAGTYPESSHPYSNNTELSWTYTVPGSPSQIRVVFDSRTEVESGWDEIYVNGTCYTGGELAGKELILNGDTLNIRLTSDGSVTYWGFAVTRVESIASNSPSGDNLAHLQFTVPNDDTHDMLIEWSHLDPSLQSYERVEVLTGVAASSGSVQSWTYLQSASGTPLPTQVAIPGNYRNSAIKLQFYDSNNTLLGEVIDVERFMINITPSVDSVSGRIGLTYNTPTHLDNAVYKLNHVRLNIKEIDNPSWQPPFDLYLGSISQSFSLFDNTGTYKYVLKIELIDSNDSQVRTYIFDNGGEGYAFIYQPPPPPPPPPPPLPDTTPPTNVSAWVTIPTNTAEAIKLSWTLPSDQDYAGAELYMRKVGDSLWNQLSTVLATYIPNNSYTVTGVTYGTAYQFKIISFDETGNKSNGTSLLGNYAGDGFYQGYMPLPSPVAVIDATNLSVVRNTYASLEDCSFDLSWTNPGISYFSGTRVYIACSGTDSWSLIGEPGPGEQNFTINPNNFDNLADWTSYKVKVTTRIAVYGQNYESLGVVAEKDTHGNLLKFMTTEVSKAWVVVPSNVGGIISVYWADPNNQTLNHVRVYIKKHELYSWDDGYYYNLYKGTNAKNFYNLDPSGNTAYDIKVVAVDGTGAEGPGKIFENLIPQAPEPLDPPEPPIPPDDTTPPGCVSSIQVSSPNNGKLNISWIDPSDTDLSKISVYYGAIGTDSGSWPCVETSNSTLQSRQNSVLLTGLDYSRAYGLWITAGDTSGNVSRAVYADRSGRGYFPNPNDTVYVPDVDAMLVVADLNATMTGLNINWVYPASTPNNIGAAIYISVKEQSGWSDWNLVDELDKNTTSIFISQYYYRYLLRVYSPYYGWHYEWRQELRPMTVNKPYRFKVCNIVQDVDGNSYYSVGTVDDNGGTGYSLPLQEAGQLTVQSTQPDPLTRDHAFSWEDCGLNLQWENPVYNNYLSGRKIYLARLNNNFGQPLAILGKDSVDYRINYQNISIGTPYKVKVTSFIDSLGVESPGIVMDNSGAGYTFVTNEVGNVQVQVLTSGGKINVSWNDPNNPNLNHVRVYIRQSGANSWETPYEYYKLQGQHNFYNLDSSGNTAYDIKVVAVDGAGFESAGKIFTSLIPKAPEQPAPPPDTTPPGTVSNVQMSSPSNGTLNVSWIDPADADLSVIDVCYGTIGTDAGGWPSLAVTKSTAISRQNTISIAGLDYSQAYGVWLTAEDTSGNVSRAVYEDRSGRGYFPNPFAPVYVPDVDTMSVDFDVFGTVPGFNVTWAYPASSQDYIGANIYVSVKEQGGWSEWGLAGEVRDKNTAGFSISQYNYRYLYRYLYTWYDGYYCSWRSEWRTEWRDELRPITVNQPYRFMVRDIIQDIRKDIYFSVGTIDDNGGAGYTLPLQEVGRLTAQSTQPEPLTLDHAFAWEDCALNLQWENPVRNNYLSGRKIYLAGINDGFGQPLAILSKDAVDYQINYQNIMIGRPYKMKVTSFISSLGVESPGVVIDNGGAGYTFVTNEVGNVQVQTPATGGRITVSWNDPNNPNLNHVRLYIKESSANSWETPEEYYKQQGQHSFKNLDSSGNTAYDVKVVAVDGVGNESKGKLFTNLIPKAEPIIDTTPPGPVKNIQVNTPANGMLNVSWVDPADADLSAIDVYYGTIGTDPSTWPSLEVPKSTSMYRQNSVLLSGLEYNQAYGVWITAEDTSGNIGLPVYEDRSGRGYFPNPFAPVYVPDVDMMSVVSDAYGAVPGFNVTWVYPSSIENYIGAAVYVSVRTQSGWGVWLPAGEVHDKNVTSMVVSEYGWSLSSLSNKITVNVPYRFMVRDIIQNIEGYVFYATGKVDDNDGNGYVLPLPEVQQLIVQSTEPVPLTQNQPFSWEDCALNLQWTNPAHNNYLSGRKVYLARLNDSFGKPLAVLSKDMVDYHIDYQNIIIGVPYKVKVTSFISTLGVESPGLVMDNGGAGYTFVTNEVGNVQVQVPATGGEITVRWDDPNNPNLNHVRLYMRQNGAATWGTPVDIYKNTGSYTFTGLDRTGVTLYDVRTSAVNNAVYSTSPGKIVNALKPQDLTPPSPVSNLNVAIPRDGGALIVSWNDPTEQDYAYSLVYWRPVGTAAWCKEAPARVERGASSFTITGLVSDPSTEEVSAYEVMVKASDDLNNFSNGVIEKGYNGEGYFPLPLPVWDVSALQVFEPGYELELGAGELYLTWNLLPDPNRNSIDIYAAVLNSDNWVLVGCADKNQTSAVAKLESFLMNGDAVKIKVYVNSRYGHRSDGVESNNSGQGYQVIASTLIDPGPDGWTTFSTPVALYGSKKLIGDVFRENDVAIAYKYNAANRQWVQVCDANNNNRVKPLEAVYVKLNKKTCAVLAPSRAASIPPTNSLEQGWNLIGVTKCNSVYNNLASLSDQQLAGNKAPFNWIAAVNPNVNGLDQTWVISSNQEVNESVQMKPGYGYWVYMSKTDELIGYTSTPLYARQLGGLRH